MSYSHKEKGGRKVEERAKRRTKPSIPSTKETDESSNYVDLTFKKKKKKKIVMF